MEVYRSLTTCKLSDTISPAFADSHRAVKSGKINELVEKGGRGSCKSSFISLEIILLILKNPLIHACVFRKYGNTLRTTVYTQIVWAIAQLGLTRKFRCTVSPMECVYIPTGQKIMFFGMDDPGKVKSITSYGAFVDLGGVDGMVHISKLARERVEKVEDVVNIGDDILVKVIEIDDKGRINLTRKDLLPPEPKKENK